MKSRNYLITFFEIGSENSDEDGGRAPWLEYSGWGKWKQWDFFNNAKIIFIYIYCKAKH